MNNIDKLILQALQTAAIAAYDASSISSRSGWTKSTRIKAIGRTLPLPADGMYIEFVHIPNNNGGDYWDESQTYQGNFRIILHWPITDNEGAYPAMTYLDELAGKFSKAQRLAAGVDASVRFDKNPSASGPIENGSELLFPLTLSYRLFKPAS